MSKLWYREPAAFFRWEEALPLGNGRLGAMMFGIPGQEKIQVNEESMWYGTARDRMNPDALRHLEPIRQCIFHGEISKAQKLLDMAVAGCPDSMQPYQTLGDIRLEFGRFVQVVDYTRSLDLDRAVCTVDYTQDGAAYHREAFISHPDDCLVLRLTADRPGSITFGARLERGRYFDGVEKLGQTGIALYGTLGQGGTSFVSCLRACAEGGTVQVVGQTLYVEGADAVTLLFGADTSYQHRNEAQPGDWHTFLRGQVEQTLDRAQARGYDALLARHTADYQALYGRAALHLDGSETFDALPTNQRLQQAKEGQADLGLNQLLFDFGRYLLISCSRPGGLPANLQGIWNQEFQPPWESKYTININAQMNYWPAESCNLSECHLPLFSLLEQMVESGRRMARGMYGCRGIVAHHNTDIHGDCAPQDTWLGSSYWVMGAAWLCTHVWTHYEYTQDAAFLRRFYPVLCETALFFLDFLVEKDGYLVTCPSLSPENEYRLPNGEQGAVTYGATMDNQILRDLFSQCLAAAEILDRGAEDPARAAELAGRGIPSEAAFLTQVRQARSRLIPNRIGSDGRIMEWVEEYEECDLGHRHISHLYGLHPSDQITMDGTPELAAAARKTLESRLSHGGGHTGWSRAWIINHYAKLWDGEKAHENIQQLLAVSTYANLFDRHPPFQIDGNFGAAAAIAEMMVQSSDERVVLLPALPQAWPGGSVRGLRLRGDAEIAIEWQDHALLRCTVRAGHPWTRRIVYAGRACTVSLQPGESISLSSEQFT